MCQQECKFTRGLSFSELEFSGCNYGITKSLFNQALKKINHPIGN